MSGYGDRRADAVTAILEKPVFYNSHDIYAALRFTEYSYTPAARRQPANIQTSSGHMKCGIRIIFRSETDRQTTRAVHRTKAIRTTLITNLAKQFLSGHVHRNTSVRHDMSSIIITRESQPDVMMCLTNQ